MESNYFMLLNLLYHAFKPFDTPPNNAVDASMMGQRADFYFEFFKDSLLHHQNYTSLMNELKRLHRSDIAVRCRNFHAIIQYLKTPVGFSYLPVSCLSDSNIQEFIEGDFSRDFIFKGVNLGHTYIKINYTGDEPTVKVTLTDEQEQLLFLNLWGSLS